MAASVSSAVILVLKIKKALLYREKKLKQLSRNQYPLMLAQRNDVNENALVIQLPINVLAHFT